jgi:hypothetical protein
MLGFVLILLWALTVLTVIWVEKLDVRITDLQLEVGILKGKIDDQKKSSH